MRAFPAQDAPVLARRSTDRCKSRTLPTADELRRNWKDSPRWRGVTRGYSAEDVVRLRGTLPIEHSVARITAEKLWRT